MPGFSRNTRLTGEHMLYLQMSNHYRRVYNAKSVVDSSAPRSFRSHCSPERKSSERRPVDGVRDLQCCVRAAHDSYRSAGSDFQPKHSRAERNQKSYPSANSTGVKAKVLSEMDSRHRNCFAPPKPSQKPRPAKCMAPSKIRDMKVYHPPRRRSKQRDVRQDVCEDACQDVCQDVHQNVNDWQQRNQADQVGKPVDVCYGNGLQPTWLEEEQEEEGEGVLESAEALAKPGSKISSRDSAYNGGVSSSGESRGPTPDQSPSSRTVHPAVGLSGSKCPEPLCAPYSMYVQFVHDITQDVLNRGIFSNRGLRQLFARHIAENQDRLDKEHMLHEVGKLSRQLGIPDSLSPVPSDSENHRSLSPPEFENCLCLPPSSKTAERSSQRDGSSRLKTVGSKTMMDSDIVRTLQGIGFDPSTAQEICQVLSNHDLNDRPKSASKQAKSNTKNLVNKVNHRPQSAAPSVESQLSSETANMSDSQGAESSTVVVSFSKGNPSSLSVNPNISVVGR